MPNYAALAMAASVLWGEDAAPAVAGLGDPANLAAYNPTGPLQKGEPKVWMDEAMEIFYVVEKSFGPDGAPIEGYNYNDYGLRPFFDFAVPADQLTTCKIPLLTNDWMKNHGIHRLASLLPNHGGFYAYSDSTTRQWGGSVFYREIASRFNDGVSQLLADIMEGSAGIGRICPRLSHTIIQRMKPGHIEAPQWQMVELQFEAACEYANPYTDQQVWALFRGPDGRCMRRPGFWNGGRKWKVRFASDGSQGEWCWELFAKRPDPGLEGKEGRLQSGPGFPAASCFDRHGFLRMSPGGRSVIHADGNPFFMVADTAWALPWRATRAEVAEYAAYRSAQGYNAVLLMSLQPDQRAEGPEDRTQREGFARAFSDLPRGSLKELRPEYFHTLDGLVDELLARGIAPVWSPLFHGFGWNGLDVIGPVASEDDASRYALYLLARYGARPALWLASADGSGEAPSVAAMGRIWEEWDGYAQPVGLHYNPMSQQMNAHQSAAWLDFQWCQTGHAGEHRPERVADMTHQLPGKAVANGEPTYENIGVMGKAAGWWQGEEAWPNLCAGGVMGVVYGAGSLWGWIRDPNEYPIPHCRAPGKTWKEALEFEGSRYPGRMSRILEGLPTTDLERQPTWSVGSRCVGRPHEIAIFYLGQGGRSCLAATRFLPLGAPTIPARAK